MSFTSIICLVFRTTFNLKSQIITTAQNYSLPRPRDSDLYPPLTNSLKVACDTIAIRILLLLKQGIVSGILY